MFVGDLNSKDELQDIIVCELRKFGIKYRRTDKKQKIDKNVKKKVFKMPLHCLELTDCDIAPGSVQQIPTFVHDSIDRILEHVNTEGLFRKAGSQSRQREIKAYIESGGQLNKSHHVVDVANLLKTFFRDLPEPILPPGNVQDCLLRCLISADDKVKAILLTLLLLPPLSLNTLAYFMRFLRTVADHSDRNKMTKENLAIIIAPNLMPVTEMIQQRLAGHVKVIEILIENADKIGMVPNEMLDQMEKPFTPQSVSTNALGTDKKKKKRRSGSLTRMFNGIRKIVGAIGSSENLDKSPDVDSGAATPCLSKSAKKRKVEPLNPFSAKKRKDVLSLMPEADSLILPNTPRAPTKDIKKSRLSLGGRKNNKILQSQEIAPPMERRWSVAWRPGKKHTKEEPVLKVVSSPSLPILAELAPFSGDFPLGDSFTMDTTASTTQDDEFVKIPKAEYESIKERVSSIEKRISHEFGQTQSLLIVDSSIDNNSLNNCLAVESVQDKYDVLVEKTESSDPINTDHLAKRLSRELKIRRSAEHKVIRSPSQRKIGTIRRRSRESNHRLSRNQSWHLGAQPVVELRSALLPVEKSTSFYPKNTTNLKRGRPNTLQTGLPIRCPSPVKSAKKVEEQWTSAEEFFGQNCESPKSASKPTTPRRTSSRLSSATKSAAAPPKTPYFLTTIQVLGDKTPMLPPNVPPRRTPGKTPMLPPKTPGGSAVKHTLLAQKPWITPLQDVTGRPSIAKLRQNAGTVMEKAKIFNKLEAEKNQQEAKLSAAVLRRQSTKFVAKNFQNNANKLTTFLEDIQHSEMSGGEIQHLHKALRKIRESTNKNSPARKSGSPRKRYLASKSPHSINRRNRLRMARSPIALRPKTLPMSSDDEEENFIHSRKIVQPSDENVGSAFNRRQSINTTSSDTPKIKTPLLVNRHQGKRAPVTTPVKRTPLKVAVRSSPRLRKSGGF